jgi:TMEM175 potassium channel family protein
MQAHPPSGDHALEESGTGRGAAAPSTEIIGLGRLETFADGVLAIAITLLVLEIKVPVAGSDLGRELLALWPSFAAYAISFLTIGIMWLNHHRLFLLVRHATPGFLMLNVLFLMGVAFLPYPTAVIAGHIQEPEGRTIATLLYGATMVYIAVMFNVLWLYASRDGRLLKPGIGPEFVRAGTRRFAIGPVAYGITTLLAFVSPLLSLALFMALAVYWLLPATGPYNIRR